MIFYDCLTCTIKCLAHCFRFAAFMNSILAKQYSKCFNYSPEYWYHIICASRRDRINKTTKWSRRTAYIHKNQSRYDFLIFAYNIIWFNHFILSLFQVFANDNQCSRAAREKRNNHNYLFRTTSSGFAVIMWKYLVRNLMIN